VVRDDPQVSGSRAIGASSACGVLCDDGRMVSADVVEYRPAFGRGLAVVMAALGGGGLLTGLVSDWEVTLPFVAPVLLVVTAIWAAYWRPAVIVSPAGVELRNVTRTIELPWPS
jgi:hypothetical protein